jgi:hypothetical protein
MNQLNLNYEKLKGAYNKKKRKYSPLAETKNAGLTQDP